MAYDFSLDKKGVISVVASWLVMAALLFAAGLIVGTYWTSRESSVSAATPAKTATGSEKDLADLPQEPVLRTNMPQTDTLTPAKPATNQSSGSSVLGQLTTPQQKQTGPQDSAQSQQATDAPAADAAEQKAQPPASEAATSPGDKKSASDMNAANVEVYTVQAGVFLDQNEATRLFKSLARKGYAPTFFTDRDDEAHQWYAVRIGAYSDKNQASNAAANFAKQEKMKAVVRPVGSL
jgi:cell division septation protein DedD